jgi:hypothetical protein
MYNGHDITEILLKVTRILSSPKLMYNGHDITEIL